MSLENVANIIDLNPLNPTDGDQKNQGDDHLRNIKKALVQDFAGFTGAVMITGVDGGSVNAYSLTPTVPLIAYAARTIYIFTPNTTNTLATPTLNISGLGARNIESISGANLMPGDLVGGVPYIGVDTGTDIRLISITKSYADSLAFSSTLPAQPGGTVRYKLQSLNNIASWALDYRTRESRSTNTILGAADTSKIISATASFTQTFDTPSNLGAGWFVRIEVAAGQAVVIPSSDGLTNWTMYSGEIRDFFCDGSALVSEVINPFDVEFTTTTVVTQPPGYTLFGALIKSAGQSGQRNNNLGAISIGGCGGGCFPATITSAQFGTSQTLTVGAGGAAVIGVAIGNAGGDSSIGTLAVVKGGGVASLTTGGVVVGGCIDRMQGSALVVASGFASPDASTSQTSAVYGGISPSTTAVSNGGTTVYGAGCGGSVDASGNIRLPGTSKFSGNGGAAQTSTSGVAGSGVGAGGGATQTGPQSGPGMNGSIRLWGMA